MPVKGTQAHRTDDIPAASNYAYVARQHRVSEDKLGTVDQGPDLLWALCRKGSTPQFAKRPPSFA